MPLKSSSVFWARNMFIPLHSTGARPLLLRGLRASARDYFKPLAGAALALIALPLAAQQEKRTKFDVDRYQIEAEINPRTQAIAATVAMQFSPVEENATSAVFELNNALQLSKVTDGGGQRISATRNAQDHTVRLNFPEPLPKGKPATLIFTYDGRFTGNEDSPVYGIKFASIQEDQAFLMYPARWFPLTEYTVDRFAANLKITVPAGYKVIAAGLETKSAKGDKITYEFETSRPGFPGSIAVAKNDPYRSNSAGATTLLYFRGAEAAIASPYGEEVAKSMVFLTGLFGLPLSASLSIIETENGAPNGYSAPGIVFLSPKAIGATPNSRLLVNQIARQWGGNSISPTTRNHIWIMNGMARMAEVLAIEQASGPAATEQEMKDIYVEAMTAEEPAVSQSARLEDYSPEYWALTGAKGCATLGMLRHIMGDGKFKQLLKTFAESNAGKSVNTEDFRKVAEQIGGRSFQGFFIQWIDSTGAPEFKLEYTVFRTQTGFRIMGKISQDKDTFRMPVDLLIETEGNPETRQVDVVGIQSEFVVESFGRPKKVTIDPSYRVLRYNNQMRIAVAIRRGEMFAEISEFADAIKEYQKALDVSRNSSLAHYRVAELFFLQGNYQSAANEFREALNGDLDPKWTEVWTHINLGKIFDITDQRERAVNEYNQAIRTKDNTQGAQEEAAKYLKQPYQKPARKE